MSILVGLRERQDGTNRVKSWPTPKAFESLRRFSQLTWPGYSRLMQDDDEATVATLEAYRAIFRETIEAHRGRVVDMAGDSVLAVFEAATGAVRAAFEIQTALAERNESLPEARRMRFRIGVNLGEVIERADGTAYGDGVNVAARLESIGEPGGVTVSGTVFDQVKNRLQVGFDFIGEQQVKNIAELVRAYRVVAEGAVLRGTGTAISTFHGASAQRPVRRFPVKCLGHFPGRKLNLRNSPGRHAARHRASLRTVRVCRGIGRVQRGTVHTS